MNDHGNRVRHPDFESWSRANGGKTPNPYVRAMMRKHPVLMYSTLEPVVTADSPADVLDDWTDYLAQLPVTDPADER